MKRRDGRGGTGEGRGPLISIFEGAGAVVGRAAVFIKACLRGTNAEGGRKREEGGRLYAHSLVLTHTTQGSIIEIGSRVCMHSREQGEACVYVNTKAACMEAPAKLVLRGEILLRMARHPVVVVLPLHARLVPAK